MDNNLINENVYENLPELIKIPVSNFKGRERDIVLLSSLGVLSCSLPKVYGFYDGKEYTPHLYIFIIGPPASGKGTMNYTSLLIEKIHQYIKTKSQKNIDECKKVNKKDDSQCPKLQVMIIPGNVSSAKVYTHLANSPNGLLIFESEADSISNMLKLDYGNFSDVLRKAFHHEKVSISRAIDDRLIEIDNPKLAIVISGTVDQITPLIKSRVNGLFSRFLYYYFNKEEGWKDVSPNIRSLNYKTKFSEAGDKVLKMYEQLVDDDIEPVEFKLTEDQWVKLNKTMDYATSMVMKNIDGSFTSTVKRTGLIFFRLCMVLTSIRNYETLHEQRELICHEIDFEIAESIVKSLLDHSIAIFELFDSKRIQLTMRDMHILEKLPKNFKRVKAIEIGISLGVKKRTMDYKLKNWVSKGILRKLDSGYYEKKK